MSQLFYDVPFADVADELDLILLSIADLNLADVKYAKLADWWLRNRVEFRYAHILRNLTYQNFASIPLYCGDRMRTVLLFKTARIKTLTNNQLIALRRYFDHMNIFNGTQVDTPNCELSSVWVGVDVTSSTGLTTNIFKDFNGLNFYIDDLPF